ncbi:hypothetical protein AB395_00004648 (plasmid) [Sinorhizobium fredii CCBAU 45436]|nr:hypothetical protein AB395_00004648 [Sinorhizobium fredii CCBAU 45436]
MIHIDIKKLGRFSQVGHCITGDGTRQSLRRGKARGAGWEFVHVAIDDAFSQILQDEKKDTAVAFLKAALAYYASLGITVERVMTDDGPCYTSRASASACRELGLRYVRTRPYTPKTNGKAERCGPMPSHIQRRSCVPPNCHNGSTATMASPAWQPKIHTPISRLGLTDNLLRLHI